MRIFDCQPTPYPPYTAANMNAQTIQQLGRSMTPEFAHKTGYRSDNHNRIVDEWQTWKSQCLPGHTVPYIRILMQGNTDHGRRLR